LAANTLFGRLERLPQLTKGGDLSPRLVVIAVAASRAAISRRFPVTAANAIDAGAFGETRKTTKAALVGGPVNKKRPQRGSN
jgi:hypothetical protein